MRPGDAPGTFVATFSTRTRTHELKLAEEYGKRRRIWPEATLAASDMVLLRLLRNRGKISKETFNDHFSQDGFKFSFHFNGVNRDARARGTIAGVSFTAGDQQDGSIFRQTTSDLIICHGC